jgi:RNA polymerase sigma-70 factor (ECF subfamily)
MGSKVIAVAALGDARVQSMTARMEAAEEEAFSVFHGQYCDRLFRYLLVFCRGDEPLARDLLQATMLKVVRAIRVFDGEQAFWNWLAAIARNSFLDHLRKATRATEILSLWNDGTDVAVPQPSEIDAALVSGLERGLAELPVEERALVESFYFESASYRSLAAEQETSEKAIESRLARARQKLKQAITKYLRYENS